MPKFKVTATVTTVAIIIKSIEAPNKDEAAIFLLKNNKSREWKRTSELIVKVK